MQKYFVFFLGNEMKIKQLRAEYSNYFDTSPTMMPKGDDP